MATALDLRHVFVSYEGKCVLHDVNLACNEGDLLLLLGPNGGGKTTLLRTILGLQQPDKGEIRVFGLPPRDYAAKFGIGYVPQRSLALEASMPSSVEDLLDAACVLHCEGGTIHETHYHQILGDLGLETLIHRRLNELSGGERQKVFIARALLSGSKLLLLDEPTTGVDQGSQQALQDLLKLLHQRGVTIVVVSHDPTAFAALSTEAFCIDGTATKEDPHHYPAHPHHAHAH